MDKQEKLIDLELKKVDLKLKRDNEIHRLSFSILAFVLTFLVTSNFLLNLFQETIRSWVRAIMLLPGPLNFILIILMMTTLPVVAGVAAMIIMGGFLKSKEKLYEDRLKDIDTLINGINTKKKKK